MYGKYLRLNITVHDCWRAVVRAVARKLTRRALRDPGHREAQTVLPRDARLSPPGT
jgi:hypothetical protein